MAKEKEYCWCPWHKTFVAKCVYEDRFEEIKRKKLKHELDARLRSFAVVRGELPEEVRKSCDALDDAHDASDKACNAYLEARDAYLKARDALDEVHYAHKAVIAKYKNYLEKLHREECPDTAWDGEEVKFKVED